MYNYNEQNIERDSEGFPWRDLIIKVLLIFLFIFLLIWLVPWPKGQNDVNLDPLYEQIYLDNIERMHEAAKNYYTTERLPKNVGDKVVMTLGEMLDKNLLVEFKDSEGNTCDRDASYVEVTKYDSEYALVTYLSCNKQQDQIVEYLGCKNLCPLNECETVDVVKPNNSSKPSTPSTPSTPSKPSTPSTPSKPSDPSTPSKPSTPVVTTKYKYEYKRAASITYSAWSNWSDSKAIVDEKITFGLSSDKLTEYRSAGTQKLLAGYEISYNKDKPIFKTTYDNLIGYYTIKTCEEYEYVITSSDEVLQVGEWKSQGIKAYSVAPADTYNTKYVLVSTSDPRCDSTCKYSTYNYYEKFTRTTSSKGSVNNVKVTCADYDTDRIPVYGKKTSFVGYEKVKEPLYITVDLYQVRTRTIKSQVKADTKWSTSNNDKTLLNQGYKLTGKKQEIK